ncbi:hypothetical protein D6D01_05254 [Aureobasidium pullulans]|uniref:Uncharacterized protein n=1 Tax=Aureobasidium pullulans TaxID=5580 RepID=A0A4S9L6Z1_AURPU|nr:hypothetical protein D6D01_05254 [Aureobasidium pullulans]
MADEGGHSPPICSQELPPSQGPYISPPRTPGIIVTLSEDSDAEQATVSSDNLLQVSHETRDDVALPNAHSDDENSPVSPEDDGIKISDIIMSRPVSPENDDNKSDKSSFFTDSDSDEEYRGRRSVSSRDHSPSITDRVLGQATNDEARFKRRRSQGGLREGSVPAAVKPSPLKFRSITREGDTILVLSPTDGNSIVITDPKVVEELDNSISQGRKTLSPVETAFFSKRTQQFLAKALEADEKANLKATPPAVPERSGTPPFYMSTAEAEANDRKKDVTAAIKGTSSRAAESGTLHRRTSSVNAGNVLVQKRLALLNEEVKKLRINPRHPVTKWCTDTLWGYMLTQYDNLVSANDVLALNGLAANTENFTTFRDERKFFRAEFDRVQSEAERQRITDSQAIEELNIRVQELEAEVFEADVTIDGLEGASHRHDAVQEIVKSAGKLSEEAQAALAKVEAHSQKYTDTYSLTSRTMEQYRDSLSVSHAQEKKIEQLQRDNQDLRQQLLGSDQKSEECRKDKLLQQQNFDKIQNAYTGLQKENAQLKSQTQTLIHNKSVSELKKAELEVELRKTKDINSAMEQKNPSIGSSKVETAAPASPKPEITELEKALKTTQDSNASLENKNSALETLLKETREEKMRFEELYKSSEVQRVWSFAHYATVKKPWPIVTREIMASLIVDEINENSKPNEDSVEALTRDQVIVWFAGDMGLSEIFNEIRALGHELDTNLEKTILSILIEQGLCYGNFDVFAAFAFAGKPVSRPDFITRMSTVIELLDSIGKKLLSAEVDRDLAKDQVRQLELKDKQQQLKLRQQAHDLKKAETAMSILEKHNGSPEGAVEELILSETENANLKFEFENLEERNAELADEIAYYERELVEQRTSDGKVPNPDQEEHCTLVEHHDLVKQIRDLTEKNRELAGRDTSPDGTAVDSVVGPTPAESQPPTHDYYAEILRLRKENAELTNQYENARVNAPDSPACPHCSVLRAQINRLKQRNRSRGEREDVERENAVFAARNSAEANHNEERQRFERETQDFQKRISDLQKLLEAEKQRSSIPVSASKDSSPTQGGVPIRSCRNCDALAAQISNLQELLEAEEQRSVPDSQNSSPTQSEAPRPCHDCGYLAAEGRRLLADIRSLKTQLTHSDNRLHRFAGMADKANRDADNARREIEALKQDIILLRIGSPDSPSSTQPSSTGNTPVKGVKDARIQELEEELQLVKKTLSGAISSQWDGKWGAAKLPAAPVHQQDDAWKTFETEGNYRTLLEEEKKLREQNAALQKNLDDFEAASAAWDNEHDAEISELESAEVKGIQARIDNFQRQLEDMHKLRETKSTLIAEKDYLISKVGSLKDAINLLDGKNAPTCCNIVREELQKETVAHESTKTQLEETLAKQDLAVSDDDNNSDSDPCRGVRDELLDCQSRLSELYRDLNEAEERRRVQLGIKNQAYLDLQKQLQESERNLELAQGQSGGVSLVDLPDENQLLAEIRRLKARLEQEQIKLRDLRSLYNVTEEKLVDLNAHGNAKAMHADNLVLVNRIAELETELKLKSRDTSEDSSIQNDLLQKRMIELENEVKRKPVHTMTGTVIQLPADDDPCKNTILELISAQTKLNELIETYPLDTQIDEKVWWIPRVIPEYEGKPTWIEGLFGVFDKFTLKTDLSFFSPVSSPIKLTDEEEPAEEEPIVEEPVAEDPNDPCSSAKKQLKNVEKQIKAFEKITELKIKLRECKDRIYQNNDKWSRFKMILKNQVEVLERDTPVYLKEKLDVALEANAKQADMIECAQIMADQHNQPMKDLLTQNAQQKKRIDELQGEMLNFTFKKGKEISFLGKQLSVLYGEREKWQNAGAASNRPANSLWSPNKTPESSPVKAAFTVEASAEASTESGAETLLPKITDDGWPCPPAEKQKLYDEAAREVEELYEGTVYVLKDRDSHMPEPKITGLFTEVYYPRWKLSQPKKPTLYARFQRIFYSDLLVPVLWILMMFVDQIDRYLHHGVSTLGLMNGFERGPNYWVLPLWITLPALLIIQQLWLLDMAYPDTNGDEDDNSDSLPVSSLEEVIAPKEGETQAKDAVEGPQTKEEASNIEAPSGNIKNDLIGAEIKLVDALDQLAGNKTVIDWRNDKKTPLQWRQTVNSRFWEYAGLPAPRLNETMTYDEYRKLGDAAFLTQSDGYEAAKQASSSTSKKPSIRWSPDTKKSPLDYSNSGSVGYELTAPLVDPVTGDLIDPTSLESSVHFASQIGEILSGYPEYDFTGSGGLNSQRPQPDDLFGAPGFTYGSAYGPGSTISGGPVYDFQSAGNPFNNAPFFAPAGDPFYTADGFVQPFGLDGTSETLPKPKAPDSGYGTGRNHRNPPNLGPISPDITMSPSKWVEHVNELIQARTGPKEPSPMSAIRYSPDDPLEVTYASFVSEHLCDPKSEEKSALRASQAGSSTQGSPPKPSTSDFETPPFDGTGGVFDPRTPPRRLDARYADDYKARRMAGEICCEQDYQEHLEMRWLNNPVQPGYGTKECRHKKAQRNTADDFGSPSKPVRPGQPEGSTQGSSGLGAGLTPEDITAALQQNAAQHAPNDLLQKTKNQLSPKGNDIDPCKDVKDKLAEVERELRILKAIPDSYNFRRRVKDAVDELRALKILYDPLRLQLTSIEAELKKEKNEHEVAKRKLAVADPAIIKTIEEAEAERQKDAAANKTKDDMIKSLEKRQGTEKKLSEDLRKQLDLARAERPSGSVVTEVIYKTPEGKSWTHFIIQSILATWLALYFYSWFQDLPEGMSSYHVAYFELRELFEDHIVSVITIATPLAALFIIYAAWDGVSDVNPYPDSDVYDNGSDDKGDGDDDKGGDSNGKDDSLKPDDKPGNPDGSAKDEPETKDDSEKDDSSKTDEDFDKKDESGGKPGSEEKAESETKDEPEQEDSPSGDSAKSPKDSGYKNPMSFFNGHSIPTVPEAAQTLRNSAKGYAKNFRSLFITTNRVVAKTERKTISPWKHSGITSVSTEPRRTMVAEDSGNKFESGLDVYCKEQEDTIEKLQSQLADNEKSLAATTQQLEEAKKTSALSYSNISSIGTLPEAAKGVETQPLVTYASVEVQTDETEDSVEQAETKQRKLDALKQLIEADLPNRKPTCASVAAQALDPAVDSTKSNAEFEALQQELESAKARLASLSKDRDDLAGQSRTIKDELEAVRKDKNAIWDARDELDKTSEKNQDWVDPCKNVKEQLKRVEDQLSDARTEIKWLRNQKRKEEKKAQKEETHDEIRTGTGDSDDDDNDDDDSSDDSDSDEYDEDNPPPGSIEMLLYVAKENLRLRDGELEIKTRQLENCHELNKNLRTKFYDANDLYNATAEELNALKAGNNDNDDDGHDTSPMKHTATPTSPSNSVQRSPRSVASYGSPRSINHVECDRQIERLTQMRNDLQTNLELAETRLGDAQRRLQYGGGLKDKEDHIDRLLGTIEELEEDKSRLQEEKLVLENNYEKVRKENKRLEAAMTRGTVHELCLTGTERLILEDDNSRLEEEVETVTREREFVERQLNALKGDVDWARRAVEEKNQEIVRKDGDIQMFGRQARMATQDADKARKDAAEARETLAGVTRRLEEWEHRDDANPGFSPKELSADPHVRSLQLVIFDMKNKLKAITAARDDAVKEAKFLHQRIEAHAETDPNHEACENTIEQLNFAYRRAKDQHDDDSVTNRALELKMKNWEGIAARVEKEKEHLAREFFDKAQKADSFEALMEAYAAGDADVLRELARKIYDQSKAAESFATMMEHIFDSPVDLVAFETKADDNKPEEVVEEAKDTTSPATPESKFTPRKSDNELEEIKDVTNDEDLIECSPAKPEEFSKLSDTGLNVAFKAMPEDTSKEPKTPKEPKSSSPVKANDGYPTPEPSEVSSRALREMKIRLRHAEDEARRLGTERNRLARENAALHLRLERKIDALEHNLDPTSEQALNTTTTTAVKTPYPTPVSTNKTKNPNKTRPFDIITSLENLSPSLLTGALPTSGLKTGDWATKFDPNELLTRMKGDGSPFCPARGPMKTPFPPFKPFEPLTAEGRRRAAERLIDAPDHEKQLQEQRAVMAAYRAARYKFDEERSDAYALAYTRLRPTVNIPVQEALVRRKIEETKERCLSEERSSSASKPSSESSEGSLSSGEWNVILP